MASPVHPLIEKYGLEGLAADVVERYGKPPQHQLRGDYTERLRPDVEAMWNVRESPNVGSILTDKAIMPLAWAAVAIRDLCAMLSTGTSYRSFHDGLRAFRQNVDSYLIRMELAAGVTDSHDRTGRLLPAINWQEYLNWNGPYQFWPEPIVCPVMARRSEPTVRSIVVGHLPESGFLSTTPLPSGGLSLGERFTLAKLGLIAALQHHSECRLLHPAQIPWASYFAYDPERRANVQAWALLVNAIANRVAQDGEEEGDAS